MRLSLRSASWAWAAGAAAAATLTAWLVGRAAFADAMASSAEERLAGAVRLGAELLRASQHRSADSLAAELALATGHRVSVFDTALALVADSDIRLAAPDAAPGPGLRAEVAGALDRGGATSRRASATDGHVYVFGASRVYWQGQSAVLRFGARLDEAHRAASRAALLVAAAVLAASLAAALALDRLVRRLAQSLAEMRRWLGGAAAFGNAARRLKLPRMSDMAQTALAANRLHAGLIARIAAAERARDELERLVGQVGEGLVALDPQARIVQINPAARRLLGLAEVAPHVPVRAVVREPALRDLLEESVTRDEGQLEVAVGDRDLHARTRRGENGGAVVLLVDVTETRRLDAVRADFVANASHELKTPLTVIRAAAEAIADEGLSDELRVRFVRSLGTNAVRLQRLVDDLLDLSRYESGAWQPERTPVRVERAAWAAWRDLEDEPGQPEVAFDVRGDGEALGDAAAFDQIFRNLLENALRYVPAKSPRIVVDVTASGGALRVTVKDNGAGMPEAALPRIFERFYRVDAARGRAGGGTGLGLAIVRHLVVSMGGEVWAESALGEGTAISFSVPEAGAAEAAASVP